MSEIEIENITKAVVSKIKERYFLIEKTFNLEPVPDNVKKDFFIETIIQSTCNYFKITKDVLLSKNRGRCSVEYAYYLPQIRGMVMRLCRELPETSISQQYIGHKLNRDHATVLFNIRKCETLMSNNVEFRHDYQEVELLCNENLRVK